MFLLNLYVYCLGLVKKFKKFYIELTVSAIYHMKKEGFMLKYKGVLINN